MHTTWSVSLIVNGGSKIVVGKVKCGLFPSSRIRFFSAFFQGRTVDREGGNIII